MFLTVISPIGFITTLDLLQTPVWRLELRVTSIEGSGIQGEGTARKSLAFGISYVTAGTRAFVTILAIDCKVTGSEVEPVAALGFPFPDRHSNKERMREALKILINTGMPTKEVEEISAKSAAIVDAYHDIMQACWGMNPSLNAVGPVAKGELDGWRWALLGAGRFSAWISAAAAPGAGLAPAPGTMAPPPGTAAETAAGLRPNPLGEPPGTETKKSAKAKRPAAAAAPPADPPPADPPRADPPSNPPATP